MPEIDGLPVARELAGRDAAAGGDLRHRARGFRGRGVRSRGGRLCAQAGRAANGSNGRSRGRCRAAARRRESGGSDWLEEFWVPHRSELLRIEAGAGRADRCRARLCPAPCRRRRSRAQLSAAADDRRARGQLDPEQFIRIHRSTILRRDRIRGLRHEGLGVWSAELDDGETLRIGRTYCARSRRWPGAEADEGPASDCAEPRLAKIGFSLAACAR